MSLSYTSTWLKREWRQLFRGATGASAARSVPTPRTTLSQMSRYVLARSRYVSPVPGITNSNRPPSRETSKVGVYYPVTVFYTRLRRWHGEKVYS